MNYKDLATIDNIVTADIQVPALNARGEVEMRCPKCGGTGHLNHYRHVQAGVCFGCDGDGLWLTATPAAFVDMVARERLETVQRAQKRQQFEAFMERRHVRDCRERPELAVLTYPELCEGDRFLEDLGGTYRNREKPLTEKQKDAAVKAIREQFDRKAAREQRAADREAAKRTAPTGKGIVVRGVVRSMHHREDPYSYYGKVITKIKVEARTDDGGMFTVWSTLPEALYRVDNDGNDTGEIIRTADDISGATVQFKATLECPGDDPSFVVAKRPGGSTKKGEVLFLGRQKADA